MTIRIWLRYLIGDRQAILTLAASRWPLVIGFLFVLSAGFAREYDGEDLLEEPWHVFIPLPASLAAAYFLFVWVFGWWRQFPSFLGLFWLTAPMAWLYAIPYERFLSPVEAMKANLFTLAFVALWRVLLMVRVLVVLMNFKGWEAFLRVWFYGFFLFLIATAFVPIPLIEIMSGSRYSEADQVLQGTVTSLLMVGCILFPFLLFAALYFIYTSDPLWQGNPPAALSEGQPSFSMWLLCAISLGIWPFVIPYTQPEQQLRTRVEAAFHQGQINEALAEMSAHDQSDFPPHWQPPPRAVSRWFGNDRLLTIWEEILKNPPAPWIREYYLQKLEEMLEGWRADPGSMERLAKVLVRIPEGRRLVAELERKNPEWDRGGVKYYLHGEGFFKDENKHNP